MLKLTMLPARQGDCLWISYGPGGSPHHLVIDGGPEKSNSLRSQILSRLSAAPDRKLHIDLLVATHIDNDHIGGILDVTKDFPPGLTIGDIWFNGYRHLPESDLLGADQGERLTKALDGKLPWNVAFKGGPVMIPDEGPLPSKERQDGLKLTLLGPNKSQLARLKRDWKTALTEDERKEEEDGDVLGRHDVWPPDIAKLTKQAFKSDKGAANGSSITLLLEYKKKRILLAADAHAPALGDALDRLPGGGERLQLDAFKLSHHGSKKSVSTELLRRVACSQYLISTNGSYFGHPDTEAIARVLVDGGSNPQLIFNSDTGYSKRWGEPIRDAPKFRPRFPDAPEQGFEIEF